MLTKLIWKRGALLAVLTICGGWVPSAVVAQDDTAVPVAGPVAEPQWFPYVLGPRELREEIRSLPMEHRPYRPMHFYGNTVRRDYYRGFPAPLPRDFFEVSNSLIRQRSLPPLPSRMPMRR